MEPLVILAGLPAQLVAWLEATFPLRAVASATLDEALRALQGEPRSLLIVDMALAGPQPEKILSAVRDRVGEHLPVVFCTSRMPVGPGSSGYAERLRVNQIWLHPLKTADVAKGIAALLGVQPRPPRTEAEAAAPPPPAPAQPWSIVRFRAVRRLVGLEGIVGTLEAGKLSAGDGATASAEAADLAGVVAEHDFPEAAKLLKDLSAALRHPDLKAEHAPSLRALVDSVRAQLGVPADERRSGGSGPVSGPADRRPDAVTAPSAAASAVATLVPPAPAPEFEIGGETAAAPEPVPDAQPAAETGSVAEEALTEPDREASAVSAEAVEVAEVALNSPADADHQRGPTEPVSASAAEPLASPVPPTPPEPPAEPAFVPPAVWGVDPDPESAAVLVRACSALPLPHGVAEAYPAAVAAGAQVVVIDPFAGDPAQGLALLFELARLEPRPRLVVHTERDDLEARLECAARGADRFLPKPVPAEALTAELARQLATPGAGAQVLVLSDDHDFAAECADQVQVLGARPTTVGEARPLWAALRAGPPAVLVLDAELSGDQAPAWLRLVRAEPAWDRVPVVAVRGEVPGADARVPAGDGELVAVLRPWLERGCGRRP